MWHYVASAASRASLSDWALVVLGIFLILYITGTWNYDYFQRQGIPSSKPKIPFLGDLSAFLKGRSFSDVAKEQYKEAEGHGLYGLFQFTKPLYMIRDPELVKVVAVKEFANFMNHQTMQTQEKDYIVSKSLFNIKDQAWRNMRATLSPVFTTSKIKSVFPLISECGYQMVKYLRQKYAENREGTRERSFPTDMRDLFSRLANDVIATAVFGASCDSFQKPENEFYLMGKLLTNFSRLKGFVFLGYILIPKIMQALRLQLLDAKASNFFDSLVHDTIRQRQDKEMFRPDMLQLLMQARDGQLKTETEDTDEAEEEGAKKSKLADDDISAQAILFFFAGFETVSAIMCLTTHMLSHHEDVQRRLQDEIAEVMEKTGGKPTYESVQSMKYLDAVINETLRMYPPANTTDRVCREDTRLPAGTTWGPAIVQKGHPIQIPIMGIHHDPQYWPDPEKFDPERFSDENKHKIKPFTYMPFGVGPRICIAQRFALTEVKLTLVHLLANFELHPCSRTKHPLQFTTLFNIEVKGGFWCELTPRQA